MNVWSDLSARAMAARVKKNVKHSGLRLCIIFVRPCRVGRAVIHTIAGKNCGDYGVRKLEVEDIERRYVRDMKTKRDHTGTTPGAEEARFVAAYARVASADLAMWTIGLTRPPYPRGLPTTDRMCRFTPQSPRLYARHGDFKALGRRSADILECWGAITRGGATRFHPVVGIHTYRGKRASLERVPLTDGGLVPSQTFKDLVACEENTAVLPATGADSEWISKHCRVGTKRER